MPEDKGYDDKEDKAEVETTPVSPKRAEDDTKEEKAEVETTPVSPKRAEDDTKEEKAEVETTPVSPKRAEDDELAAEMGSMTSRFNMLDASASASAQRAEQEANIAEGLDSMVEQEDPSR